MASMQPSEISTSLSGFGGGLGEFFTNVESVVQSVGSIYDQLTGKSQNVPGQIYSQSPIPVPVPVKASVTKPLDSGSTLAIGAIVLIGVLLLIRD